MNDELKNLLEKYRADELTTEERQRLGELMKDAESRKAAMAEGLPDAIFLADETMPDIKWDAYWDAFQERMVHHQQAVPSKSPVWNRLAAAAVLIVIISLAVIQFMPRQAGGDQGESGLQNLVYQLQHRRIQDVSPQIQSLLSEDKEILFDYEKNRITVTDHAENIEKLNRMLNLLDRERRAFELKIRFLYPETPGAGAITTVGAVEAKNINLADFRLSEELDFTAVEDQQFNQDLKDRYRVICLARLDPENSLTLLANISVFDQVSGEMIFKSSGIKMTSNQIYTLRTGKENEAGEELIIALNLESIK